MALMPKRVKYRKNQRGKSRGVAIKGSSLGFGEFGLMAIANGWLKNTQLEAARVALTKHVKRGGKIWMRVFPDKSVTKKPAETRQGKGKGMPDHWVAVIKRGRILFEMDGIPLEVAKESMRLAATKLPLRTRFVTRSI